MQLSLQARKAMAAGLAGSTLLWAAAGVVPQIASAAVHSDGCLVLSGGIVWLITGGTRRGFTSAEVFMSGGYNFSQVVTATAEDAALPVGPIMTYADGTLVMGPNDPLVYLVANGQKRPFVSGSVFLGLGYSFANIQVAPVNTFQDLPTGSNLDSTAIAHPAGTRVISGGAVWLMTATGRMGYPSGAVFTSYGIGFNKVVAANSYDLSMADQGAVSMRAACTGGDVTPPPVSGSVSASLASNNPASTTLVAGQATADLLHVMFSGSGVVTSVTVKRTGVSADATPANVYLFDGATRLTDAGSVGSNSSVTFSSGSGLFTVSGSKTVSVKADIASGSQGQTVGFQLTSFTVGGSTIASVVTGNTHTIASATLATVSSGTVTPTGATLNPGAAVTLWQSTLTVNTRDVWMKRVALRNVGSAPAASFANFKLFVNGVQVGTGSAVDANGYVTFDFSSSPVLLASGSRVVRMDADVISGASRTVQFSVRTAADIDLVDSSFGVNITPTSTPWAPAAASTISGASGGSLTIEKDVTSPSGNVVNASNDVLLGVFKLTAFGEPIKVETLRLAYTGSANIAADDDSLRNARLMINGVQYGSTASLNETTDTVLAYTSYTLNYTVVPGTPVLVQLRGDIFDGEATNDIVAGTDTILPVVAIGSLNAQRVDSLGTFNAPAAVVSGNTLSVASTAITGTKNGTYADQTTTLPVTNYKIGSWNLAGSSVEDILLTTLSFDIDEVISTEFDEGDLTNVYVVVKNGSTVVAQPAPLATVGATDNNFSVSYTLPKNQSVTIELFANMSDDGSDSAIDALDSFKTDIAVTGTSLISGSAANVADGVDGQTIAYALNTLTASVDASSPITALVTDNQTIDSGAFRFAAANAGFNVTDVTLTLPATGVTVASSVMLYEGSTLIASMPASATTTFSGLTWNVPMNTSKVLTVKLALGNVGPGAGTTGSSLLTTMTTFTAVSTSTGVSDASAADAGPSIEATADPAAANLIVHSSVPVISQVAGSTTLVNGIENDMFAFSVNPSGGAVAVKQLKFTVTLTDNSTDQTLVLGTFKLYRGSTDITSLVDIHNTAGATIESTNTLGEGGATAIVTWATEEQISSATTYTLKATPGGYTVGAEDDLATVNLATDASAQTATNIYLLDLDSTTAQVTAGLQNLGATTSEGTIAATVTTGPNVIWSDMSALSHLSTLADDADAAQDAPTSSADWRNGFLIQSLPLAGLSKNN